MKLSKETIAIIKNFASINSNLLIKAGNRLTTISDQKNVFSAATLPETFDVDFGIYDTNQFLGVLSLFTDPDLEFNDKFVTIKEAGNSVKYYSADSSVLTFTAKEVKLPSADIEFLLTADNLSMIQKTSSILSGAYVSIVAAAGIITLVVGDIKNPTSNTFSLPIGTTDKTFNIVLKVENLKFIPGDYAVAISSKKLSRYSSKTSDLVYFVAVEAASKFPEAE